MMKMNQKPMCELIDFCMYYLTRLTKDEADLIDDVISWEEDLKLAFKIAKRQFDGENE